MNAAHEHARGEYTEEQIERGDANLLGLLLKLREQELEDSLNDLAGLRGELLEARAELSEARSDLAVMRRVLLDWLASS